MPLKEKKRKEQTTPFGMNSLRRAMPLQVRKQKEAVHASYRKLQRAPVATKWNLSLDDLVWAVNVATSRPFSIPSHWTESIAGEMCLSIKSKSLTDDLLLPLVSSFQSCLHIPVWYKRALSL